MPRTASKDKVNTISIAALANIDLWTPKLTELGFQVVGYQYSGEGSIVSATCTKNEREQVITPELFDALTSD